MPTTCAYPYGSIEDPLTPRPMLRTGSVCANYLRLSLDGGCGGIYIFHICSRTTCGTESSPDIPRRTSTGRGVRSKVNPPLSSRPYCEAVRLGRHGVSLSGHTGSSKRLNFGLADICSFLVHFSFKSDSRHSDCHFRLVRAWSFPRHQLQQRAQSTFGAASMAPLQREFRRKRGPIVLHYFGAVLHSCRPTAHGTQQ